MKSHLFGFALLSAIGIVASAPAQAQNGSLTRSFVSSSGLDSNSCTITAPCATFAEAYTKISANGIIAALDPGKYGPLTIVGPVTINGNGWAAITGPSGGTAIAINAGSGNVILTGLEVDGAGTAYNGIVFNSGSTLTVINCIVKDFVINNANNNGTNGNGIWIAPTTGTINFTITNTMVLDNSTQGQGVGILYFPQSGNPVVTGAIDHVVISDNANGIVLNSDLTSEGSTSVSISNSVVSNNSAGSGIYTTGVTATIDSDQISNNMFGVVAQGGTGTALVSRSVITKNSQYGIENGGTVDTFQNNQIYANGHNNIVSGTAPISVSQQ
jgi:hypothetical protein